MSTKKSVGQLVIIGGGEDRPGEILEEFVRLAGGPDARIVVSTAASDDPGSLENQYRDAFQRIGVAEVQTLRTPDGKDEEAHAERMLASATGVFLTGGAQHRLVERLSGTTFLDLLRQRMTEGLVLAGTSAGASAMSETMLISGDSEEDPYAGMVELGKGFGFLPGVVIDQHFTQRGRLGRLLGVLGERPEELAVGIAEDTAIVVSDRRFRVIGKGSVTVLDAASLTHCNRASCCGSEPLALCGVTLHILPPGYEYNMATRSMVPPETPRRPQQPIEPEKMMV